jgi:hypothetical protein
MINNKMLVIGYPVNYETICKFFKVDTDQNIDIDKLVKEKSELELHLTDKGQFILGLEIKESRDLWYKFTDVDKSIILILEKKKIVKELFDKANIDLSEFELEKMEGEPELVHNPPLFLITF